MIEQFKHKTIGVIAGGLSAERDVSLRSGKNVLDALQRLGYTAVMIDPKTTEISSHCDLAFIALHGRYGEDGAIQGYCETVGLPYTGSRILASAMAMDKVLTKTMLAAEGIAVPEGRSGYPRELTCPKRFPAVLKPVSEGSSVGVFIVASKADFQSCLDQLDAGCPYIVEDWIKGMEITVGIIERDDQAEALPVLALTPQNQFYDYEAKYTPGMTTFTVPAPLSKKLTKTCQDIGLQVHRLMGCRGMSRVDMIVDPDQGPVVLEVNTIPGLTDLSDLPAMAQAADIPFDRLIEIILGSAA